MGKRISMILLVALTLLLAGCETEDVVQNVEETEAPANEFEKFVPVEKAKDKINISAVSFRTLNPLLNKEKTFSNIIGLVYESLFNLDENYNPSSGLVSSFDFQGTYVDINLKDANWSDGNPLTSQDVAYTINYIKKNPESPYYYLVKDIRRVDARGYKDLRITSSSFDPFLLNKLIFPIVPSHIWKSADLSQIDYNKEYLVGSGMYRFDYVEKNRRIELVRNESYGGIKPFIPKVGIKIIPSDDVKSYMLLSGETDICSIDDILSEKYAEKNFRVVDYKGRDFEFISFNFKNKLLNDIDFRKAVAMSIEKERILKEVYLQKGIVQNLPVSEGNMYYEPGISNTVYSNEQAKSIIEQVKLKEEFANVDFANLRLTLCVNKESSLRMQSAYIVRDSLRRSGINVDIVEVARADFEKSIEKNNYDMYLNGWTLGSDMDIRYIERFIGNEYKLAYGNTMEEFKSSYGMLQRSVVENSLIVGLVLKKESVIINERLDGEVFPNAFDVYKGFENLKIK